MKEKKQKTDKTVQQVLACIQKYDMIQAGDKLILGVSGGADSVCLFSVLVSLQETLAFSVEVVHINHMLRATAARDEEYVKSLCARWQIPFHGRRIDVRAISNEKGISLEEAGREARYEAFEQIRASAGADKIAVAHHAGDQAETLLFHLCRGSGIEGLCGIKPIRGRVLRPLLDLSRQDIELYLEQHGLAYMTDETNAENTYARNILRNQVLPLLEDRICHGSAAHMAKTAELMQETFDFLGQQVEEAFQKTVIIERRTTQTEHDLLLRLQILAFEGLHSYLQKEVLRRCLFCLSQSKKDISAVHIEAVYRLMTSQVGSRAELPYQITVWRSYDELWFEQKSGQIHRPWVQQQINIRRDGADGRQEMSLSDGRTLVFRVFPYEKDTNLPRKAYTKWLDYDKIVKPLVVRTPQDGDFFYFDDKNRKFVKDYMVNEKIPARDRESSLMVMEEHHMLYFLGKRISNYYKVSEETKNILEIAVQEDKGNG